MKISKELSAQKYEFAKDLMGREPKLSVAKVNAALAAQFGAKMNVNKLYALKKSLTTDGTATLASAEALESTPVAASEATGAPVAEPAVVSADAAVDAVIEELV